MRALVTGGGGFLGGTLVRQLLARGDQVRSFSRGAYPELKKLGIQTIQGDLTSLTAIGKAVDECDAVFHVAARVGGAGPRQAFYETNVLGTQNVIEACRRHGVEKLIYTSTPSVVHTGLDIEGGDESLPYASHFEADYPSTKAEAERLVLAANDEQLSTVALRPHLIWGPGDPQLIPRLLERARAGHLRIVGDGRNRIDATYIDNAAAAHLLAADRLGLHSACAGRAYFIAQGEPMAASRLINLLLEAADLPPITRNVPKRLAWLAGLLFEAGYRLLGRQEEPPITRFAASQLGSAHWFDLSAARKDLGYEATVSTHEGLKRLRIALASEESGDTTEV